MDKELFDLFVDLQEDMVLKSVQEKIALGVDAISIAETCRSALIKIGELFSKKEYFLSELVMSGEIFREVMEILEPKLVGDEKEGNKLGKIVTPNNPDELDEVTAADAVAFVLVGDPPQENCRLSDPVSTVYQSVDVVPLCHY